MRLDDTDIRILEELQKNARCSNKELAASVHLSPSACLERLRKLRAAGAFQGFHARVDEHLLGIRLQALISVRLTQHLRAMVDAFWDHVMTLPEVVAVYHVAGDHDFMVHVAVRDADHLRDLAMDAFTTRPEVATLETRLVFKVQRAVQLPVYPPAE